jgi:hypothetical protein
MGSSKTPLRAMKSSTCHSSRFHIPLQANHTSEQSYECTTNNENKMLSLSKGDLQESVRGLPGHFVSVAQSATSSVLSWAMCTEAWFWEFLPAAPRQHFIGDQRLALARIRALIEAGPERLRSTL